MAVLLALYFAALSALALFGVHRLILTAAASRAPSDPAGEGLGASPPSVLVQLPIYNEAFVADRLIRACAAMRYPAGRMHLQVLDDSTDETAALINRTVRALVADGHRIDVVRREDRAGYKAGALANGLALSDAALVAIFDADFIPPADFLERAVPVIAGDPGCGMVQARWSHLNRGASWLTRAQALYLDGHFGVEHVARACSDRCFNFNGTAGIWRRAAIDDAGGWSADTITEDLDLSYRAQLAGWRFAYLDRLGVPAELPESWMAFRAQQARWVKGSVQTARKQLRSIVAAPRWSLGRKAEAVVHVTSNLTYALMALIAVLLPAAVVVRDQLGWQVPGGQWLLTALDLSMLTAGTLAMVVFYVFAIRQAPPHDRGRLRDLPFALCLGAGMSLSNAHAVFGGLRRRRAAFVRTPKRGGRSSTQLAVTYRSPPGVGRAALELLFAAYFTAAIAYAIACSLWASIPFLVLYQVGFLAVGTGVMKEALAARRRWSEAPDLDSAARSA